MDLTDQVVIVTGSSSGIGASLARRLAEAGARIVLNSASSVEAGTALAAELPEAVYVQGDVGDPATSEQLVSTARERWGRIDGVVNNAGVSCDVPLHDIDGVRPEHWDRILRTNVIGTFQLSQAALPQLREAPDGWILNITSIAGIRQTGSSLPYAVSKAALDHLTTLLAKFAGGGVRVNAIAPGLIETPWTEDWDLQKDAVRQTVPTGRVGTPEDVVDACIGIIGSRYTTGQTLLVDGGLGLMI